ncbi:hypothetical protein O7598_15080 [Micromonospora sp. WMMC241]|uniref:hypothetical protein n=1 Tax=Micromonospora sp. WMMC241 TaxID=3015159 RepID=UPI0022B67D6C|nr:hypothetical protein [Micromonospora sp. WMMC241]MCZ7437729.1 hypothetical protein [Micromonospora sp. WMMC241]
MGAVPGGVGGGARARRGQERVAKAAEFCASVLTDGWVEVVSDRATAYVTEETWTRLFRRRRRKRCKLLARMAGAILAGKKKLHDLVGAIGAWLVSLLGGDRVVQSLARELASRIPLPPDAKMVAAARGLQVTGVLLCLVNGDDLTRCQCFIDLALEETKTQVKKILVAALEDWTGLAQFPAKPAVVERGVYGTAGG